MIYHFNKLIETGVVLIPVPSERLKGHVSDYTEIHAEGAEFKIIDRVTITKLELIPTVLILLSTGMDISDSEIWNKYKRSNRIIFFVCKKI